MRRLLNPVINYDAFRLLFRSILRYRELLWEITRRDVVERQAGLAFARFWVIGQPLIVMLVYTFVFTFIFKSRLGAGDNGTLYTAFLLAGLAPWVSFQEAIGRAPTCLVESRSLIKQIVFPVELIPLKLALSSLLVLAIGLAFPLVLILVTGSAKPLWWMLLPVPIISQLLMMIGLVYILAATGVFLPDIRNLVQLALMIGLFVQPILYTPGMLPRWTDFAFGLIPFSHVIWIYRDAIMGEFAHPASWILAPILGLLILTLGYRVFRGLRHGFGDAL